MRQNLLNDIERRSDAYINAKFGDGRNGCSRLALDLACASAEDVPALLLEVTNLQKHAVRPLDIYLDLDSGDSVVGEGDSA